MIFLVLSEKSQSFLMAISTGSIFQAVSSHQIKNMEIRFPSLAAQEQIARFLNKETAQIETAIRQSETEITLIREYRERLILDAVTGQIDLRSWQGAADDTLEADLAALAEDDSAAPEAEDMDDNE